MGFPCRVFLPENHCAPDCSITPSVRMAFSHADSTLSNSPPATPPGKVTTMNYSILPGLLAVSLLAGCQSYIPNMSTSAMPSPDRYGAASAVAVARHAQYQMWDKGIWSGAAAGQHASNAVLANSGGVSFDWEGDAVELLAELARIRGLQFNYSGVRLPLPVTIHVRGMTYSNVLRLVESQTAWRATLHQYPGLLQLNFMQSESGKK